MVASSIPVAQANDPRVGASATLLPCLGCMVGVVVPFPLECHTGQTLVMLTLRRSIEPCKGFESPVCSGGTGLTGCSVSHTYLAYTSLLSPGSFSHGQGGRVDVLAEGDHERAGYHYREVISFHFKYKPYGGASGILFTLQYYTVH